tara:strand:- start:9216 stop:10025 length:810 start_codon:yes stop_codon:yes gene_type:complete
MKKVAIFGVPRSGTSWLGQIFNSSTEVTYRYQPIFSYSFDGKLSKDSSNEEIRKFHSDLLKTDDPFVCQKQNISGNSTPGFKKTDIKFLAWKEVRYLEIIENLIQKSDTKVIGIVRHPCGVIKSWMKAPKEFNSDWDILEEWRYAYKKNKNRHDYYGFEKWIETTRMFIEIRNKYPSQFEIVRYENLLQSTETIVTGLFEFCGIPLDEQTLNFINDSTSKSSDDPYDVYRKNKRANEWKDELPKEVIDLIMTNNRFIEIQDQLNGLQRL